MAERFNGYGEFKEIAIALHHPLKPDVKGCIYPGSGTRRIEAQVVGINDKPSQDWRLLCESMPMTWNHTMYNSTTHCEERVSIILTRVLCYCPHVLTDNRTPVVWE